MRLNIETRNPEVVKEALQSLYHNQEVTIEKTYPTTATFRVLDPKCEEERCFPIIGLLELPGFGISLESIRIL